MHSMFGSNKTISTKRLTSTIQSPYILNLAIAKCRYEPKAQRSYDMKYQHIVFTLFCDILDIEVSDRIVHGTREFVVCGIQKFDDQMGAHMEVEMREIGTASFHENVEVRRLSALQPNYDSILQEYTDDSKDYDSEDILVLIDNNKAQKRNYQMTLDA